MLIKKRLFLTLPIALFLIYLITLSFNRGMSSIFYINFDYFISPPVTKEKLNKAESLLETANQFSSRNPQYYQLSGVLKTWKSNEKMSVSNRKKLMSEASEDYIQSILLQADNPFFLVEFSTKQLLSGQ